MSENENTAGTGAARKRKASNWVGLTIYQDGQIGVELKTQVKDQKEARAYVEAEGHEGTEYRYVTVYDEAIVKEVPPPTKVVTRTKNVPLGV